VRHVMRAEFGFRRHHTQAWTCLRQLLLPVASSHLHMPSDHTALSDNGDYVVEITTKPPHHCATPTRYHKMLGIGPTKWVRNHADLLRRQDPKMRGPKGVPKP
jgi:hypothetical protein